ncbi:MAG: Rne/Rng family ribonuclease [Paludibacteraceae bacterium]|nr:Rne/Rng family ribonuclease [Paludibacteraceae bacterium]
MKSELIVDVQPQEIAIALTEDDRLQEVAREKRDQDNFAVGNIYYGRVKKVMPALNAVFVDVGYEKEAFLHYLDLGSQFRTLQSYVTKAVSDRRRLPLLQKTQRQPEVGKEGQIADVLKVGDPILVQVSKEPINTKGPRLTAEISIAGRNIVLIPFADGVMVSQKIKREAERQRLKQLMLSIKPQGFGIIVRTVAEDKRVAELDNELRLLVERWQEAVTTLQRCQPVSLVCEEMGRTLGIIRDVLNPDFTSIQINDKDVYDDVRHYLELIAPESAKIVKLYQGTQPIFDHFDITRQMKTGLGRTVGFKHGGYLIIDRTEALFSIDVNSGSKKLYEDQEENAFQFNMLAADELVHQLRLRDIGGIIIVDFIDMDSKEHQQQLYDYVRRLMERDRARHNVLPLSKFGLMQITRQRVRPAVEVDVMETCPTCMGKGKIQPSIFFTEQVEEECAHMFEHYGRGLYLHLHPFVYAYASRGWLFSLKFQWLRRYGIHVIENQSLGMLEMRFLNAKGEPLQHTHAEKASAGQPKEQPKQEVKTKEQPKQEAKPKEQPKQEAKPKEQPKQEDPKETATPKKRTRKKAKQEQSVIIEPSQQEPAPKAKRSRKAAKPKPSPVEPAAPSPAETKAPAAVKKRARRKKASAAQENPANGE